MKLLKFSLFFNTKFKTSYCTRNSAFHCKYNAVHKKFICLKLSANRYFSIGYFRTYSMMSLKTNHLVFVYGTLKKNEPNHDLIENRIEGRATFIGNAKTVKKWPLIIASRYNIPYLLYSEGKGMHVIGEVYEVDDIMLAEFDKLECHPEYYTRLIEEVQLISENEGKTLKPWIYFLKNFRPELLDLPCLSDYSSNGSHGLKYVSRYNRPIGNYYSDVMNI